MPEVGEFPKTDLELSPGQLPPSANVLAVYQVLSTRFTANANLVWTVPALGLSAQAFLISAGTQSGITILTGVLLSLAIFLIGFVAVLVSQWFDNVVLADRVLLDRYEKLLLGDKYDILGLGHAMRAHKREEHFKMNFSQEALRDKLRLSWLVQSWGTRPAWAFVLLVTTLIGASIPLLNAFRR